MTSSDQAAQRPTAPADRLRAALSDASSSARLQSALAAGTYPDVRFIPVLVDRSGIEPDFFVRDMLTWALTRHPASHTVPRLLYEVGADSSRARSQALHTLSKIGDPRGWSAITAELLRDPDDEVATTAWRTAVGLVPAGREADLAEVLATQLGRGTRETQRSLTRSIVRLGEAAVPVLRARAAHRDIDIRLHAVATERLIEDPEEDFDDAVAEARRTAL
jgi:HEAT repeat protein